MVSNHVLEQAPRYLRGCFGERFAAPYRLGKVAMADCLLGALHLPQQETFAVVEALEQAGAVHFEQLDAAPLPQSTGAGQVARVAEAQDFMASAFRPGAWRIDAWRPEAHV